ncbi:MAG: hypothetical protein AW07_04314 [Candidatus Accumulibacter sp. SK-11]|nr:MAG: hypothetical protein AW07_04314 [Candidatus Accumulibacter sp. SK-11]
MAGSRHRFAPLLDQLALRGDRLFGEQQPLPLALLLVGHLGQAVVDLRLPLAKTFLRLRQLQCLDLDRVRPVLQHADFLACVLQLVLRIRQGLFDGRQGGLRAAHPQLVLGDDGRQLVNLALPLEQPVRRTVGSEQGHALPADDVAAGRHTARVRRQATACCQRAREIGGGQHIAEPVTEDRRQRRVGTMDARLQAVGRRRRRRHRRRQRQQEGLPTARTLLAPRRIGTLCRQRR